MFPRDPHLRARLGLWAARPLRPDARPLPSGGARSVHAGRGRGAHPAPEARSRQRHCPSEPRVLSSGLAPEKLLGGGGRAETSWGRGGCGRGRRSATRIQCPHGFRGAQVHTPHCPMHTRAYTCTHTRTHTQTCIGMNTTAHECTHKSTHTHEYVHVCVHMRGYRHVHMDVPIHMSAHACTDRHTHECTHKHAHGRTQLHTNTHV